MNGLLSFDQLPESFVTSVKEGRSVSTTDRPNERQKRSGLFTASQIYKIITPTLKKPDNTTYRQYVAEKAWERITGFQVENGSGARQTDWGHEWEPQALFDFTITTGIAIEKTGAFQEFFKKEGYPFGSTPDGIVTDALGNRTHTVEVKCPFNGGIHFQNLRYGRDPEWFKANRFEYWAQVQSSMWAAEVETCYFISYDPGMSRERDDFERQLCENFSDHKLMWTQFNREETFVKALIEALDRAEDELQRMINKGG